MNNLSENKNGNIEAIGENGSYGGNSGNGGNGGYGENGGYSGNDGNRGGLWRGVRMSAGSADAIVLSLSALLFAFILSAILLATR